MDEEKSVKSNLIFHSITYEDGLLNHKTVTKVIPTKDHSDYSDMISYIRIFPFSTGYPKIEYLMQSLAAFMVIDLL